MLTVLTMMVASPASVERDTLEVELIAPVTEKIIGHIINAVRLFTIVHLCTCPSTDIDECSEAVDRCNMNAVCTDTDGSFTCTCQVGFSGDGLTCASKKCVILMVVAKSGSIEYPFCIDINECSEVLHNCDMNADCADTDGSFTCTCREGFEGDGISCNSKKDCLHRSSELVKYQMFTIMYCYMILYYRY